MAEKSVWEEFYSWFRLLVKEWVLEEIALSKGFKEMERLEEEALNKLFYHHLTKHFTENTPFLSKVTDIVNEYIKEWIEKIMNEFNIENNTIEKIENLLCFKRDFQTSDLLLSTMRDFAFSFAIKDHLLVMNSPPYQSVREAIYKKIRNHWKHPLAGNTNIKGEYGRFHTNAPFWRRSKNL